MDYQGQLACPSLPQGLWFAWVDWAFVLVLFVIDIVAIICIYFYTQRLMHYYADYVGYVRQQRQEDVAFANAQTTVSARLYLRGVMYAGFFLWVFIVLIQLIFFNGEGFWYTPYLQYGHAFMWLWLSELGGSMEAKLYVWFGGSDASRSSNFGWIIFYTLVCMLVIDGTVLVLTTIELINTYIVSTIVEYVFGWLMLLLVILLVLYDIYMLVLVSRLTSQLEKLSGNKFTN